MSKHDGEYLGDYFHPICPSCLEECGLTIVDDGIGAYEFWGAKGFDSKPRPATDCCEAPPQDRPMWIAQDVDPCHLNGGDVECSKCPAREVCMDATPVEDEA